MTIPSLLLAAGGVALAQPATDVVALEARLQATEAELDAAADALRVLLEEVAQGKRFVVADRPLAAVRSLDDALRYGQPPTLSTLEQAIAMITFYLLPLRCHRGDALRRGRPRRLGAAVPV